MEDHEDEWHVLSNDTEYPWWLTAPKFCELFGAILSERISVAQVNDIDVRNIDFASEIEDETLIFTLVDMRRESLSKRFVITKLCFGNFAAYTADEEDILSEVQKNRENKFNFVIRPYMWQ